jgi:hypothetical protein
MAGMVFGIMMAIILIAGFIEAGYIIGQAALDKYVRVAEIAVGAGHGLTMGKTEFQITKQGSDPVILKDPVVLSDKEPEEPEESE